MDFPFAQSTARDHTGGGRIFANNIFVLHTNSYLGTIYGEPSKLQEKLTTNIKRSERIKAITIIGSALFSLFFGAGNIIFPLTVGSQTTGNVKVALTGFLLTAVVVPFTGLLSAILFKGDYTNFFGRIGKIPGLFLIVLLLCMLGPFGGIPRLITLTFSTCKTHLSEIRLAFFAPIACAVIFLLSYKRSGISGFIGRYLAPLLLLSLLYIITKGLFFSSYRAVRLVPSFVQYSESTKGFFYGLKEGYYTMDLMASFFFASLAYNTCRNHAAVTTRNLEHPHSEKLLLSITIKSAIIGAILLGMIYLGLGLVAAEHRDLLIDVPKAQLFVAMANIFSALGPISSSA